MNGAFTDAGTSVSPEVKPNLRIADEQERSGLRHRRANRKILNQVWPPAIGKELFQSVRYSRLSKVADDYTWGKKTYNNAISALRCAFEFGYRYYPEKHNPASALKCFRITKKDRPRVDPFNIHEAEIVIAAIHRDWGEAQGNYDEFRFFTGLRPSEQIARLRLRRRAGKDSDHQGAGGRERQGPHEDERGPADRAVSPRSAC